MCITSPDGFLYATFLRPIWINLLLLHRVDLTADWIMTPESGMHYFTLVIYFYACHWMIKHWEKELDMFVPIHKLSYSFCLMMLTFFFPFEWVYLGLYDYFHSIPVYGYPVFLSYGWWNEFPMNIFKSILFVDGYMFIGGVYCCAYVAYDLTMNYPLKDFKWINFDKISKVLLACYILTMALWVTVPLYSEVDFVWGTPYFPQTIYPEYGYYEDYNLTSEHGDIYGIVNEIWIPNDLVKILNHSSKAFSVAFMFYTFAPRKKIK